MNHEQFREDMEELGLEVVDYSGRYWYHGPAVMIERSQFQEVLGAASVPVKWDSLGLGLVVYPQ